MIVKVLGSGCANCQNLEKATRAALADLGLAALADLGLAALADLGLAATVEKVTDFAAIAGYGVMRTPALVVDETVVFSGRVPTVAQVRDVLTKAAAPSPK